MTRTTTPEKKPRQTKTPRQRAEEALGVADRAVEALGTKREKLRVELDTVMSEYEAAARRRDYLAQNPDLGDTAQLTLDDTDEATS